METLRHLLSQASIYFNKIGNLSVVKSSQEALKQIQNFMEVETQINTIPNAMEELQQLILTPYNQAGSNYTKIATIILARSGWAGAVDTLIQATKHPNFNHAVSVRLNIIWLKPNPETALALQEEILRQNQKESPEVPIAVFIEALIRQRSEEIMLTVLDYLQRNNEESDLGFVLASLVTLMPEQGLAVMEELEEKPLGELYLTALGLKAVYKSEEAYQKLLDIANQKDEPDPTVLYWLGRIPRPESLPILIKGLAHSSEDVRFDIITSLSYFGTKEANEAFIRCLSDCSKDVADQAMSALLESLGEDLDEFSQNWLFDEEGRLSLDSSQELANIATNAVAQMQPKLRYYRKSLMPSVVNLEDFYLEMQPDTTWYHWVAATGVYQPYDIHQNVLYNYPSLELLNDWYQEHANQFEAGKFYYHGKLCEY